MFTIKQLTIHDVAFVIRIHLNKLNHFVSLCARSGIARYVSVLSAISRGYLLFFSARKKCNSRFDAVDRLIVKEVF